MKNLSVKKSIVWNMILKYAQISLQILFGALLARILTPTDFGVFSIISIFTTFFGLLGDMGFGAAIVQDKELSKEDIDHIYSGTVYFSFILSIVFSGFSIVVRNIYQQNALFASGVLLSLSLFFNCINMIPNAVLRKNLCFAEIGARTVIATIISNCIAIIMALKGFKYYSLVVQSIVSSIIIFFLESKECASRIY